MLRIAVAGTLALLSLLATASKDGICILYADDNTRSFYFSGVTPTGALHPQLLNLPTWDAVLCGLDSGEDEDTMYIVPQGVGASPNMTLPLCARCQGALPRSLTLRWARCLGLRAWRPTRTCQ